MELVKHETCLEYFRRRLSEGWECISLDGYKAVLLSPEGIRRELDLRNDVETLRPDGAGDVTDIEFQIPDSTFHWEKVDEAVADDETTQVYSAEARAAYDQYDLYSLGDSGVGAGTINSVTVYCVSAAFGEVGHLRIKVKTHATEYAYDKGSLSDWASYSQVLATNPNTTDAWTWDEIDALQVGPNHYHDTLGESRTTQVYVEVDYTPEVGLENKSANMAAKMMAAGLI